MEPVHADEAARALTEIGRRQRQVIDMTVIPIWFWWAVAALMVGFTAGVETRRPVVVGLAIAGFVLGILVVVGVVVAGPLRRAPVRNELLAPGGVLAIVGFVALVLAVSLPTAFALRAAGVSHPGTWGVLAGAVLMVTGGPALTRYLRRLMLRRQVGGAR